MTKTSSATEAISTYRGSQKTREKVEAQVRERWGVAVASQFDPFHSAMTLKSWSRAGFKVKKGAKALRSTTLVEKKDEKGEIIRKYLKTVYLFHALEVEPRRPHNDVSL